MSDDTNPYLPDQNSSPAFNAYLRALAAGQKGTPEAADEAIYLLNHATVLDPNLTIAYFALTKLHSDLYFNGDPSLERRAQAESALANVRSLATDSTVVRLAEAFFTMGIDDDPERAYSLAERVPERNREASETLSIKGWSARQQGRLEESLECLKQSFSAPRALPTPGGQVFENSYRAQLSSQVGKTLWALRRFEEAEVWFSRTTALTPDAPFSRIERAMNLVNITDGLPVAGRRPTAEARELLNAAPWPDDPRLYFGHLLFGLYDATQSEPAESKEIYNWIARQVASNPSRGGGFDGQRLVFWREVISLQRAGEAEMAETHLAHHLEGLEQTPEDQRSPLEWALLGIAHALSGDREAATMACEIAISQTANSPFLQPGFIVLFAKIRCLLGELDSSLDFLETALGLNYGGAISTADLRLDPVWDPLRESARYHQVLARFDHRSSRRD